ncbi:hypothetical protein [Clostridium perfringens]|uniref:hypothetical protein n=1 Tax=Clostridium perfringens TaxID=1502 RepID=UPI003F439F25
MSNTVDEKNFNITMEGYVIRACKDMDCTQNEFDKIMRAIHCAKDMMTMEQAREEYGKYYDTFEIQFREDED